MKLRILLILTILAAFCLAAAAGQKPKYVFMFIGDGMAMPQINSAESYSHALAASEPGANRMAFSRLPVVGLVTTYDAGSLITDSASAVTALATGHKTLAALLT